MDEKPQQSAWKTSYSLLDRIKDPKDQESWKEFVNYYEQYIYNIIRHFQIVPAEAEDLCQEITIELWKKMPDFIFDKTRGKFRQWLSQVIRHHIFNYIRNKKRRNELLKENNEYITDTILNPDDSTKLDQLIDEEWKQHISDQAWLCIKKRFKESAQKVFLMSMDGKSTKEIAKECGIAEGTVYVYRNKVKAFLEEEIARHNENFL